MPIVRTKYGVLEGVVYDDEEHYIAFKGIPYAKPPIGSLRFKAPEPPEAWQGVRDGSKHGPMCPQYNERGNCIETGNEDCLYLNVYTKCLTPQTLRPVMVWIHGGSFYTGSGNSEFYGPEFFMAHDVVLVTINYRLEVLGFLCLDTEEVPGNAGLKDQVMALNWVKSNVHYFGGDPNNITIFGCSAGAASVSYHLVSRMSEGLFNKAICQSGTCLNEWSLNLYARERAFQLGRSLGLDTDCPTELLNFLRDQPVMSLVNITLPPLNVPHYDFVDSMIFNPVVEKAGPSNKKFLSAQPTELVKSGHMANVPIIIGYTSGEGIEIARRIPNMYKSYAKIGFVVPRELKLNLSPDSIEAVDKIVRDYYFENDEITAESFQRISDLETDRGFAYHVIKYARYHSAYVTEPVFLYVFNAETERNYAKKLYNMEFLKGVCHADELPYLFNVTSLDIPLSCKSIPVIEQLVQLWVNFASTGKPTLNEKWKPFSDCDQNYAIIGTNLEYGTNPREENIALWDYIYEQFCNSE